MSATFHMRIVVWQTYTKERIFNCVPEIIIITRYYIILEESLQILVDSVTLSSVSVTFTAF